MECQFEHLTGQEDVFESIIAGSSTAVAIVVTFSDNDTYAFNAYVRSVSHSQSMDEVNRSTIVLKVTGDITHTTVA